MRSAWLAMLGVFLGLTGGSVRAAGPLTPVREWNAERAAHLLRRAGFGGTPRQVQFLTRLGAAAAVDYLVYYQQIGQSDADFVPITDPDRRLMRQRDATEEERRTNRRRLDQLHRRQFADLQAWWFRRMIATPRPLEEKMTLFWHGHFTSEFRKVRNSTWLWNQNQFLRTNALGTLRELLIGISKDPAMLRYLDNATNRKAEPNENYARELMELFTMGEGNYTEDDVSEAARAFTGWTATNQGSHLVKRQHDDGKKTVLGRRGRFDGEDVIDIILEQPATARHLAGKLLVFFVEPEPPRELINALAAVLRRSGYDFRDTMRVLLGSKVFYSPRAMYAKIKSPVELIVGSVRLLEGRPVDLHGMAAVSRSIGQELFQPPNVKGWDGGRKWINTATLFGRYNASAALLSGGNERDFHRRRKRWQKNFDMLADLQQHLDEYPGLVIPPPQFQVAMQPPYDPMPIVRAEGLTTAEAVVDHFVERLLQMPITTRQRAALLEVLEADDGGFDVGHSQAKERILRLIATIMSAPEYQLS